MGDKNQDMIITEGEESAVYGKSATRKTLESLVIFQGKLD